MKIDTEALGSLAAEIYQKSGSLVESVKTLHAHLAEVREPPISAEWAESLFEAIDSFAMGES